MQFCFKLGCNLRALLCSGCTVISPLAGAGLLRRVSEPGASEEGGKPQGRSITDAARKTSEGVSFHQWLTGSAGLEGGHHLRVFEPLARQAVGVGAGTQSVRRAGRKWVKFQAFSRHWSSAVSPVCFFFFSLTHNLSYILRVFVRALCQTHWLWKNNLDGFNLLPPPTPLPPPSLPHACAFFFFPFSFPLFDLLCVPLRGWEFILFGNFVPSPLSHCRQI